MRKRTLGRQEESLGQGLWLKLRIRWKASSRDTATGHTMHFLLSKAGTGSFWNAGTCHFRTRERVVLERGNLSFRNVSYRNREAVILPGFPCFPCLPRIPCFPWYPFPIVSIVSLVSTVFLVFVLATRVVLERGNVPFWSAWSANTEAEGSISVVSLVS